MTGNEQKRCISEIQEKKCISDFLEKPVYLRKLEYERISKKYPDLIPIILQKSAFGSTLPELRKFKFLIPKNLTMSSVMMLIRKHLGNFPDEENKSLNEKYFSSTSIFLFNSRNELLQGTKEAGILRKECASEDGFVYIQYAAENTMG